MSDQETADYIREVAVFAIERKGKCFRRWPASTIFKYLAAHHLNGSLYVERDYTGITGIAVGWQEDNGDIQIREVIGNRSSARALWAQGMSKIASFNKIITYRLRKGSPVKVEIPIRSIESFMNSDTLTLKETV